MPEFIFGVDALRAAHRRLDLPEVAKRTLEVTEDDMPGGAWLDATSEVHYAETMSEVDGLMLCRAREPDEDDELDNCYWVGGWLRELGLEEFAERLEHELKKAVAQLISC